MSTSGTYAANIISSLNRNPVSLIESFQLVLEADGPVDADPDLNVLEKDFYILNTSQSTSMSFVNGTMSQKRIWTLELMSREVGIFTIPSIDFGKDKSPALRVTVKKASSSNNNNPNAAAKNIFLEVEVDQKSTWVQSQIIYTVYLFHSININNPSLSRLETSDKDAIIERLGNARNYQAFRNGTRYGVSELSFAVYPQHSGTLIFKPILLEGRISTSNSRSLFEQFWNRGKLHRVYSKRLSVKINPRPDGIQLKNWLPAKNVTLKEEWSEDIQQLKIGEPVTRTITLAAEGQMATYLPDITLPEVNGFKQYPDKPVQQNTPSQKGMTGTRQIKIAMIPTRAGNYKIPALSIPWWNSRTGEKEIAQLPEVVLKVTGAIITDNNTPARSSGQTNSSQANSNGTSSNQATDYMILDNKSAMTTLLTQSDNNNGYMTNYWPWISLVLATGWLLTLAAYFRKYRSSATTAGKKQKKQALPVKPLEQTVLKLCKSNKAKQLKDALLAWAQVRWPDKSVTSLCDIAQLSPPALNDAIMSLNTALYSANNEDWSGEQLSRAFKKHKKQAAENSPSGKSILEPLYKT